jgi:hypothetical protein
MVYLLRDVERGYETAYCPVDTASYRMFVHSDTSPER